MSGIRAGDIQQFTWYGRTFDPAPETDITLILPGIMTETTPNGNGTEHTKGTRRLGGFDGLSLSTDWSRGDLEFIVAKQSTGLGGPCSMTLVDGTTYAGVLKPEGDLNATTGAGAIACNGRGAKWAKL